MNTQLSSRGAGTGHTEGVEVEFDPSVVSYTELLSLFMALHDPTDAHCQGNDCGCGPTASPLCPPIDMSLRRQSAPSYPTRGTVSILYLMVRVGCLACCRSQYRSAVFYHSESQRSDITIAIKGYEKSSGKQVATQVGNAVSNTFWPAEDYHQHYLQKAGQDASIGSLAPIQCYGNRGPIKKMDKPSIVAVLQKEL
eukprot:COSAG01_NODE_17203_length_1170_cov_1.668534_1_plen_196_part_00